MDNGQTATRLQQPHRAIRTPPQQQAADAADAADNFVRRHIGPSGDEVAEMLASLGLRSLDELVEQTVPAGIRLKRPLKLGRPRGEEGVVAELRGIAAQDQVARSLIGMGYSASFPPPVIQPKTPDDSG